MLVDIEKYREAVHILMKQINLQFYEEITFDCYCHIIQMSHCGQIAYMVQSYACHESHGSLNNGFTVMCDSTLDYQSMLW